MVWGVLVAAAACAGQARAAERTGERDRQAPVTISGVHARLFENRSAEWSADLLAPDAAGPWNTVATANATLIVVEVSGPPGGTFNGFFGPRTRYAVRLVATERRRTLLDARQTLPVLNDQGKVSLVFLVHQGGCAPVHLAVSIDGAGHAPRWEGTLPFACGE